MTDHKNQPCEEWILGEDGPIRMTNIHGAGTGRWRGDGRVTSTVYPIKYMVVLGDMERGFTFYGPFVTIDRAHKWAILNLRTGTPHDIHRMYDVGDKV